MPYIRDFTREGDKLINMEGKEGRRDIVNRHKRVYIYRCKCNTLIFFTRQTPEFLNPLSVLSLFY